MAVGFTGLEKESDSRGRSERSQQKHEINELIIVIRQQTMKENAGKDRIC